MVLAAPGGLGLGGGLRGSVLVSLAAGGTRDSRAAAEDEDSSSRGGENSADGIPPTHLRDILKVAKEGVVITEALKKAIVEAAKMFGLEVVDDNILAEADVRSQRVLNHVGSNSLRLKRSKARMQRPKEIPNVETAFKMHGEMERAHTRDMNMKVAISVCP